MKTKTGQPRPKRGKQLRIEGLEPESIPEIDQAAEIYHARKLERCEMSKEENAAKDNLIDKMRAHGVSKYETPDGLIVEVTDTSNVKTKRKNQEENGSDE